MIARAPTPRTNMTHPQPEKVRTSTTRSDSLPRGKLKRTRDGPYHRVSPRDRGSAAQPFIDGNKRRWNFASRRQLRNSPPSPCWLAEPKPLLGRRLVGGDGFEPPTLSV